MTAAAQMNCCFMWYGMNSICLPGKKNHETFYSSCAFHKKIKLKIQKNCVGHLSQGWDSIMFSTFLPITSHICRYVCFYVLTIFFCCCSLFISLESFTISKTYILVHGSIRLIMTGFFLHQNAKYLSCSSVWTIWHFMPMILFTPYMHKMWCNCSSP